MYLEYIELELGWQVHEHLCIPGKPARVECPRGVLHAREPVPFGQLGDTTGEPSLPERPEGKGIA